MSAPLQGNGPSQQAEDVSRQTYAAALGDIVDLDRDMFSRYGLVRDGELASWAEIKDQFPGSSQRARGKQNIRSAAVRPKR